VDLCRTCDGSVFWAASERDGLVPVDADDTGQPLVFPDGTLEPFTSGDGLFLVRRVAAGEVPLLPEFAVGRWREHEPLCRWAGVGG